MAQKWTTSSGDDFACLHCGAAYAVMVHRFPTHAQEHATCECCHRIMKTWVGPSVLSFTLLSTLARATSFASSP